MMPPNASAARKRGSRSAHQRNQCPIICEMSLTGQEAWVGKCKRDSNVQRRGVGERWYPFCTPCRVAGHQTKHENTTSFTGQEKSKEGDKEQWAANVEAENACDIVTISVLDTLYEIQGDRGDE